MARRKSRTLALSVLFQIDVGKVAPSEALAYTLAKEGETERYARKIVEGVVTHGKEIDRFIAEQASEGWNLRRMPPVDRNILRIALYEIVFGEGVPHAVAVDEAVELAKIYGAEETPKFVNGVLGGFVRAREVPHESGAP